MFVDGIAIKRKKLGEMEVLGDDEAVSVSEENGLEGDYRGKRGSTGFRQVTIISSSQWEAACRELDISRPWFCRRANLCVEDYSFSGKDQGRILAVGDKVLLEITGELEPCARMDEIFNGLREALTLDWRGGVTCRVLRGGEIRRFDRVTFTDSE
ncbi:MAG TPA: MOSC domain-containing protein [Hyphomicrobiales bacterium]|nr:MOSC domain-containing protein [Hyphomicrobiales bacterium]